VQNTVRTRSCSPSRWGMRHVCIAIVTNSTLPMSTQRDLCNTRRTTGLPRGDLGLGVQGWVQAGQGATADGLLQMRDGLTLQQTTGGRVGRPSFLAFLTITSLECSDVSTATRKVD